MQKFKIGDRVRIAHPTGGIDRNDEFEVVSLPSEKVHWIHVKLVSEKTWRTRYFDSKLLGFEAGSLELIERDPRGAMLYNQDAKP